MKKHILFSTLITLLVLVLVNCKKIPEIEEGSNKKELPTISTTSISEITTNSAISGGEVTNDGNLSVTSRGVCWNTTENPTLQDNLGYTNDSGDMGNFTSSITGLNDNTTYYVTAYATNEKGTAYGSNKNFTTLEIALPTITTTTPTDITSNSAISGGHVTSDGNSTVTDRGVCWNTTGNPTLSNSIGQTSDGSGMGNFTSDITGLDEGTTYYVVAYATNSEGTSYGEVFSFTTFYWECGDILNYEEQGYSTVLIGTQCWMAENLNVGIRIDGYQEVQDNSIIEKYCYYNNEANCDIYGGLYQWDEMMQYTTAPGVQGICPNSWHLPTDDEWKIMEMELGMSQTEADGTGWRGTDEGKKMKSTSGWDNNGNGTNSSGFTALPGGYRGSGSFLDLGKCGFWWSSSENTGSNSWYRSLNFDSDLVLRSSLYKPAGFSVRCLKD